MKKVVIRILSFRPALVDRSVSVLLAGYLFHEILNVDIGSITELKGYMYGSSIFDIIKFWLAVNFGLIGFWVILQALGGLREILNRKILKLKSKEDIMEKFRKGM